MTSPLESAEYGNDAWRAREEILDRFEVAWREQGDADIEQFLPAEGTAGRDELLCELIKIDLEYRWERGQKKAVEGYFGRFPQLARSAAMTLDLIREELAVRRFQGCPPAVAELRKRFPEQSHDWEALCRGIAEVSSSRRDTPTGSSVLSTLIPGTPTACASTPARAVPPARLGRFEIQEVIGKGGFAAVYRAWDPELQRDTAIKVPAAPLLIDDSIKARLLREATSAARLRHPAIVAIHEVSKDESCPFIVYEYIPGPTLAQVLRDTPPSPRQAAQWVTRIAEALEYAHANGIVHRDVKPANIMMAPDGQPLLADFGLALQTEAAGTLTQEGDVLGTPAYMSPEQAAGRSHAVDARTDVYALGVVLYELLVGRLPFVGGGVTVLHRVLHEEPAAPRALRPELPIDLETICLRAMAKEPGRRYASAGAMAEDLRRYLEHRPILARRLGVAGRMLLWSRRQPALAATIAVAVFGVATVAAFSIAQIIRERDNYHQERDRAQANLYRALAGETRALMKARDTGWWWKAMENLETAAQLETAPRDLAELRELAIECMGTKYPCMRLRSSFASSGERIHSLAFNPSATMVAAASGLSVQLWRTPGEELLASLQGHSKLVTRVAFHPQGRWLASASLDGDLRIWDVQPAHAPRSEAIVARLVPSAKPGSAQVMPLCAGAIYSLAFGGDGSWIAAGCQDGTIRLLSLNPQSGAIGALQTFRGPVAPVTCLTSSPDGSMLAAASRDRTIRVWKPPASEPLAIFGVRSAPNSLAFAHGGEIVAWSDDESFGFDAKSIRDTSGVTLPQLHTGVVTQVAADQNQRLVTASLDGSIKLWGNAYSRIQELAVAREQNRPILSMAWSQDRRWAAAGAENGRISLWEISEPEQRALLEEKSQSAAFIDPGRTLAKSATTWDLTDLTRPQFHSFVPPEITALASHPTQPWFVYGDAQGRVFLWKESAEQADPLHQEHKSRITSLAVAPDGSCFASASIDGSVVVWDWHQGCKRRSLSPDLGTLGEIAWLDDSCRIAVAGEKGALLWNTGAEGNPAALLDNGVGGHVLACGGGRIALGTRDGAIRIYDQRTGALRRSLGGHRGAVSALAFSGDGAHLASAAEDKTLRIWDTSVGLEKSMEKLPGEAPPWLAFEPGGAHLITGSRPYSSTAIWDVRTLKIEASFKDRNHAAGCFLSPGKRLLLAEKSGTVAVFSMRDIPASHDTSGRGRDGPARGGVWLTLSKTLTQGGHVGDVWGVASSPDGRWIATSSHDGTVKLWDVQRCQIARTLHGAGSLCWCVAFSADSKYVAAGAGDVVVWEVASGRELRRFRGHKLMVTGVAFHPQHGWLASTSYDGCVRLWDVASGRSLGTLYQAGVNLHGLAFRKDGALLAVGADDRRLCLWNCADWNADWVSRGRKEFKPDAIARAPDRILMNSAGPVRSVAFDHGDGVLASGSEQGAITLWRTDTLEKQVTLRGDTGQIRSLSFSQDGALLAAGAYTSPTLVWDLHALRTKLRSMNLDW
jgi:WD40 repeat protein